jgi:hypothetical protein
MRLYFIVILFLLTGCVTNKRIESRAITCLRDMLINEDPGGTWSVVLQPVGSNLQPLLTGDNPCIQFSNLPCGQYELRYIVGDICCRDTSIVRPLKCCLTASTICN